MINENSFYVYNDECTFSHFLDFYLCAWLFLFNLNIFFSLNAFFEHFLERKLKNVTVTDIKIEGFISKMTYPISIIKCCNPEILACYFSLIG